LKVHTDGIIIPGEKPPAKGKIKVCEDYLLVDKFPAPNIILADGCSASKFTDVGARILCFNSWDILTSKNTMGGLDDFPPHDFADIITKMLQGRFGDVPDSTFMDSTLICSYYTGNDVRALMFGDGVLIHMTHNTTPRMATTIDVDFEHNAPFYLSYELNESRMRKYRGMMSDTPKKIRMHDIRMDDGRVAEIGDFDEDLDKITYFSFPVQPGDIVIVASDGIKQILDKANNIYDLHEFVKDLLSFKNMNGTFLQRRMKRIMDDYRLYGFRPYDDISIGAYYFTGEPNEGESKSPGKEEDSNN